MNNQKDPVDLMKMDKKIQDASTCTSDGILDFRFDWRNETNECFWYAELTEYMRLNKRREIQNKINQNKINENKINQTRINEDAIIGIGDGIDPLLPMRRSLFPYVAPYVRFHSFDCECKEKLPWQIRRFLKWKLSPSSPRVIIRTLIKSGFELTTDTSDWSGMWNASLGDPVNFRKLKTHQKINSFPGSFNIGYKNHLWRHVSRMRKKFGRKNFDFLPRTYLLPGDMKKFQSNWQRNIGRVWIIKPPSSARGQGVKVTDQWWDIPKWHSVVVQRYITNPRLINGSKFDLRVYVLVTSINPLRIYVYREGLVRFASVKYIPDSANLSDRYMHLTNTSINKQNPSYVSGNGFDACRGHKWSFKSLWRSLESDSIDTSKVWQGITDIVVKTMISAESDMNTTFMENITSSYSCYELYGFDIILDENCRPWLLEVNIVPSLHIETPLDIAVKGPLVRNVLNMAGYHIPSNLSTFQTRQLVKEYRSILTQDQRMYNIRLTQPEKAKQSDFGSKSNREDYQKAILEDLTRDDLRHLVRYEDELSQIENFEKIFPTSKTYVYHKFFEAPRYYNRLLDAWERRYGENRQEGIDRIRKLCKRKLHLVATASSSPIPIGRSRGDCVYVSSLVPSEPEVKAP